MPVVLAAAGTTVRGQGEARQAHPPLAGCPDNDMVAPATREPSEETMRYALICAAVMLALLLLWPLAFAPSAAVSARPDLPASVSMPIPPPARR